MVNVFFFCSQRRVFHLACQRSFCLTANGLNTASRAACEKMKHLNMKRQHASDNFLQLTLQLEWLKIHIFTAASQFAHYKWLNNNPPFTFLKHVHKNINADKALIYKYLLRYFHANEKNRLQKV